MITLCVIPTYRCNISCAYCFNDTHENIAMVGAGAADSASAPMLERVCAALARHGVRNLAISGGEPLASKLTPLWIASAASRGLGVRVISNLTHLPSYIEEFLERFAGFHLTVSLGGLTAEDHDRFRQRFSTTAANIERLRGYGPRITVSFVLDRFNARRLAEMEAFCKERNFNLVLSPLSTDGGNQAVQAACLSHMPEGEWSNAEESAASPTVRLGIAAIRAFHEDRLRVATCAMRNSVLVLTPEGGLYGCFFRRDLYHGNLFKDDPDGVLAKLPANGREPAPCFSQKCLPVLIND